MTGLVWFRVRFGSGAILWLVLAVVCGLGLVLAGASRAAAADMDFRIVDYGVPGRCGGACPKVISAEGEITNDTPRAFLEFVAAHVDDPNVHSVVFLHSQGGGVAAAMRLGEMFRKTGVLAVVARLAPSPAGQGAAINVPGAHCFSACVYALMGAKKRVVPPTSLVGIHRMYFFNDERDAATGTETQRRTFGTSQFVAQLAKYASSMGVSRELIYTAEKIDPDNLHIVTTAELQRWHLATRRY
jgi:hypothetical protein